MIVARDYDNGDMSYETADLWFDREGYAAGRSGLWKHNVINKKTALRLVRFAGKAQRNQSIQIINEE